MSYLLSEKENGKLGFLNILNIRAWNSDIAIIVTEKISSICVITTRISVTIGKNTNIP